MKIKIIIDENKRLSAYELIGDLVGGMEIEVDDEFKFEDIFTNYIYENGKLIHSPNKRINKKIYEEKFKKERQERIDADFEYKGSIFQMRENEDLKNFEQKLMLLLLKRIKLTDAENWRLKDNTYKDFTIAELLECADLWGARKKVIWKDFKRICEELEKANSIEEIEAIRWEE